MEPYSGGLEKQRNETSSLLHSSVNVTSDRKSVTNVTFQNYKLPICVQHETHGGSNKIWREMPELQKRGRTEQRDRLRARFAGIDHAVPHLILHNVCMESAQNGSVVTVMIGQDDKVGKETQDLCRDGVLQVCVLSYVFGDGFPHCPRIPCRVSSRMETSSKISYSLQKTKMLSIVSMRSYSFGWHALLDNFMSYWGTWMYPPGDSSIREACPRDRDILFVDDLNFCKSTKDLDAFSFLVIGALGLNGSIVHMGWGEGRKCYHTVEFGAVPTHNSPKYAELLLAKPQLFSSLTRCIFSRLNRQVQNPNAGTVKRRVVFLNREAEFGYRRIDNLKDLANELRRHELMPHSAHSIDYVDGLVHLDFQSQLRTVTHNTLLVISPHGSQLMWLLFSAPGSAVIEIFGEDQQYIGNKCYWTIAKAIGLEYMRWEAKGGSPQLKRNIVVDDGMHFNQHIVKVLGRFPLDPDKSSTSITINFSILHHHTDGAAIYGFMSGLAILYETKVEMVRRNISFNCVLHLTDLYKPGRRSSKTNIYSHFSIEAWHQLGARIGCTILPISTPVSATPTLDLLCVKNDISWDKNSFRIGEHTIWNSCPLRPDRTFNGKIHSYLEELPNRLAEYVSCAKNSNRNIISILLYTKGTHTGTSLFHAYAFYSINLTRPMPYTGLLSVRKTRDHRDVASAVSRCIFLFDSGRCEILRSITGLHHIVSAIKVNSTIKCVVVKEISGLFNYTNGKRHEIRSKENAGFDNRAIMSFAESSKMFVADVESHWPDHILSFRSRHDLPSLMLDCHDKQCLKWIPYWNRTQCRNAVFRRGQCVTKLLSWVTEETWQPGSCPLSRHGQGDGYHDVL
jgi:hypothetical protein